MTANLELANLHIRVTRKAVRNLHLSVNPPDGTVRITAPDWMGTDSIRLFAINKLGWIRREQKKMRAQERETPREYIEDESHYVWGQRYLLHIIEHDASPAVSLTARHLVLRLRPGTETAEREAILYAWYREEMRRAIADLLAEWQPRVGRVANRVFIQRMKTKWGSCNTRRGHIRLNSELARKPRKCLEYVLLHEMMHLREPTHNSNFIALMDALMPHWRDRRDVLNRLPVRNEDFRGQVPEPGQSRPRK
ncbi:MAG: M48 family metallopeptidase [Nitrosospira sp.]|nr:M48 family metallopeptidase [Nitrosospira sp.]